MSTRIMKWVGSVGLALVLALSVTGLTFAAPSSSQNPAGSQDANMVRGTVQAVGSNSLTVLAVGGQTTTVTWDDSTLCVIWGTGTTATDNQPACARIQVGDAVKAVGDRAGDTLKANRIFAGTSAPGQSRSRVSGTVQALGTNTLTILSVAGQTVTVAWNSSTICLIVGKGAVDNQSACADIQVGDHIRALGQMIGDTFNASRIVDHVPGASSRSQGRVLGTVQAVNTSANSLTVVDDSGATMTVAWADQTVCSFVGRGNPPTQGACSMIQAGDHVMAVGMLNGSTLTATRIAVHIAPGPRTTSPNGQPQTTSPNGQTTGPSGQPRSQGRVLGTVQAVNTSANSLTVVDDSGATMTVAWADQTVCSFVGRGNPPTQGACSMIQAGDHVMAVGMLNGSTLTATRIAVHIAPGPRTTSPNK